MEATSGENASSTVSWTAPASDGGSTITIYTVTSDPEGITATTGATSATVSGLTNGTSYTFTVTATNSAGEGAASSPSAAATPSAPPPVTVPDAPTGVTATSGENASSTVSWTAPASDGGSTIITYTVTSSPGGFTATTAGETSVPVSGLTNGTSYTFTVTATNGEGEGAASSPSAAATPAVTVPGAPTGVIAYPVNAVAFSISVEWTAPASDGGATITEYTVTSSPGGVTATANGSSSGVLVEGLTDGEYYTFTVTATNSAGTGPPSESTDATMPSGPPAIPGAPTGVVAIPNNNPSTLSVSWGPANSVGSNIIRYTVTSSPEGFTGSTTDGYTTSLFASGLTSGTDYTFTVTATNSLGTGPPSDPSEPRTPNGPTAPGAPTDVFATSGEDTSSLVSWTAPAANGGATIITYTVTSSPGGFTATTTGETSATVSGLTDGTPYTFRVTATNSVGTGAASSPSAAATPGAPPPAPSPPPTPPAPPAPVPCFPSGTRILTASGYKTVESLAQNELVMTADGRPVPVKIYGKHLEVTTSVTAPYKVPKGTFGLANDLVLSPDHAFQIRKGLWMLPKRAALLSDRVEQVGVGKPVTYYHLECPSYLRDNLVVDGAVVESYGGKAKSPYTYSETLKGYTRSVSIKNLTKA